jgi:aquaporin Z
VLFAIASGQAGFSAMESGFASNGYGDRSPGGYGLLSGLIIEVVITAVFVYIILSVPPMIEPRRVLRPSRSASA